MLFPNVLVVFSVLEADDNANIFSVYKVSQSITWIFIAHLKRSVNWQYIYIPQCGGSRIKIELNYVSTSIEKWKLMDIENHFCLLLKMVQVNDLSI